MTRQADAGCPKCGSFYRNGDDCNKCGCFAPVPESFYSRDIKFQDRGQFQTEARIWSKQDHKYVGKRYN